VERIDSKALLELLCHVMAFTAKAKFYAHLYRMLQKHGTNSSQTSCSNGNISHTCQRQCLKKITERHIYKLFATQQRPISKFIHTRKS